MSEAPGIPDPNVSGCAAAITRLMVIDDDPIQRRVIARIAGQAGHEVEEVASVAAAEALLKSNPWDCITVDLGLADGVGADLIHLIAQYCPQAQVLIITGESGARLRQTLRVAAESHVEIHDTFLKPLDLVALRDSLRRAREILWARREAA